MDEEDRERIEERAAAVLAEVPDWLWDGETLPVPIEDIVDSHFDLLVRDVEPAAMGAAPGFPTLEEGTSISGLFLPADQEIWVNAEEAREWPPRRRFTIGHELGHCVLHQDGQHSLFCRHGSVDATGAEKRGEQVTDTVPEIEREANQFAGALLMPAELMRHHYRATGRDFGEMCRVFGASGAAMSRRMRQTIPAGY